MAAGSSFLLQKGTTSHIRWETGKDNGTESTRPTCNFRFPKTVLQTLAYKRMGFYEACFWFCRLLVCKCLVAVNVSFWCSLRDPPPLPPTLNSDLLEICFIQLQCLLLNVLYKWNQIVCTLTQWLRFKDQKLFFFLVIATVEVCMALELIMSWQLL